MQNSLYLGLPRYGKNNQVYELTKTSAIGVTRLGNFLPIGLLLEAHYDFFKDEVAQRNGDILCYFLLKQIYYIFTSISSFITWFVVGILRFQKRSDVDVLGFQIKICCRHFGLFWLGDCLGYFLKNWAIFSNLLVTLSAIY